MRVGKGCGRCRHRHIRCIIPDGASSCTPCARLGRVCHLDPRFQFKAVHHIYQKGQGTSARFGLVWHTDQVWVDVTQPVTFVHESDDWDGHSPSNSTNYARDGIPDMAVAEDDSSRRQISCERQLIPANAGSPVSITIDDALSLSFREASLVRRFIQKIAPWVDICDPQSHFSTIVPRRALQIPMVLKAVLALAARHDAIMAGKSDWEASSYHGQCLELLIPTLDQAEQSYDENLLITVVTLRIYEELENNTNQKFHLLGSNRLINLMSQSASTRGLAEAVSWQFLRQAIYASVVQYQPLQLELQNYGRSCAFRREDDAAFANMIIFHCARTIQLCRDLPRKSIAESTWAQVADAVEEWNRVKPITWQPIRYQAPNFEEDRPFPEIWMMAAPAVVGMQYYHTAGIFLTLSDPRSRAATDYEQARDRRGAERSIASHIKTVIALSLSNESVQNAYFMASHLLYRFGYCLRHPVERRGSLLFLSRVEKTLGWRTAWMQRELEQQWRELDSLNHS